MQTPERPLCQQEFMIIVQVWIKKEVKWIIPAFKARPLHTWKSATICNEKFVLMLSLRLGESVFHRIVNILQLFCCKVNYRAWVPTFASFSLTAQWPETKKLVLQAFLTISAQDRVTTHTAEFARTTRKPFNNVCFSKCDILPKKVGKRGIMKE